MLNAAVIGVGSMGKNHARIYANLDNVNLVAVCDRNEACANKIAKMYSAKAYVDFIQMLDNEKIDLISLVVPTSDHHKVALQVISKGIHLLIEKPIAVSLEEGKEIIAEAESKNVKLAIGHIERFNPAIVELKRRMGLGELGRIFKIDIKRVGPFPSRITDVGVVIDLAVHDLDIMRYVTLSEPVRIYAESEKKIHSGHEDLLSAFLRFENDVLCNLTIDRLSPTKVREMCVVGEKGMFVADTQRQNLLFYENKDMRTNLSYADILRGVSEGHMISYSFNRKEPLLAEIESFVDCVVNDKSPLVGGKDGLIALKLALDILKSSREKVVLTL